MICGIVMAAALAGQQADTTNVHPHEIKTSYDRVKDYSACRLRLGTVVEDDDEEHELDASLSMSCVWKGAWRNKVGTNEPVYFTLSSSSKSWEFLKYKDVSILFGTHRLTPEVEHDGDVHSGYVTESTRFQVTYMQLKQMAESDPVEFAVGTRRFDLKGSQVVAIKDFISRFAVNSDDAEKLEGERATLLRKRNMELQEEMDKAVDEAREAVKKLPWSRRGTPKANQLGIKVMTESFSPTYLKYAVQTDEYVSLLKAYPEFSATEAP